MTAPCVSMAPPPPDRRGDDDARDRARLYGRRVALRRTELAMTTADVARELAIDRRTVTRVEVGDLSDSLEFGGYAGRKNVERLERGEIGWMGRGGRSLFVGPGLELNRRIAAALKVPAEVLPQGLYFDAAAAEPGSLEERVMRDTTIGEKTRELILFALRQDPSRS